LDGKVIATEYQVIADGHVYALRSDFDPAYSDMSPGTFLNHYLLKRLFGSDLIRYYMGPGENAYKMRWTDHAEPIYRLTAYSPTARGQLLRWLNRSARLLARRLRDSLLRLRPREPSVQNTANIEP
jgi:CelD/BcsL family acetyltransferase involved in cellulose biosynthesis